MGETPDDMENESAQGTGGSEAGAPGGEGGAGGSGSAGGSSRSSWQDELAAALAAQRARRQAATGGGEVTEERTSERQQNLDAALSKNEGVNLVEAPREDLASLNQASSEWSAQVGEWRSAAREGATWWGESSAAVTAFLAPVPAMLLVFLNIKVVPIPIPIPVMYKPETLTWSKKAEWNSAIGGNDKCSGKEGKATPMRNVPQATFKGGGPEKLEFELFYDTTDTQLDVRLLTKPIQLLVYKVPLRNEPPLVMFSWGVILSKPSYIEDLEIDYTMFRADGTPLRAEISMTLTEYDLAFINALPMNPTSYSEARKTWVVTEGQTLDWIAYQEYGNANHWRHIAQVNNLANPRDLRSGQILKLTPLDSM